MTSNDLATDVHNYLADENTGTVSMSEIQAATILADHPELAGMNAARAARKLRRVLAGFDDIVKLGAKRGAVYVYDPDDAADKSRASRVEERILMRHLYGGGRCSTESLFEDLTGEFPKAAVDEGLHRLLRGEALMFDHPDTILSPGFWTHSGLLPRGSTSFTHAGTTRDSMEMLTELLTEYARDDKPLPGVSIPAPNAPSRSTAIEVAIIFTVASLKSDLTVKQS